MENDFSLSHDRFSCPAHTKLVRAYRLGRATSMCPLSPSRSLMLGMNNSPISDHRSENRNGEPAIIDADDEHDRSNRSSSVAFIIVSIIVVLTSLCRLHAMIMNEREDGRWGRNDICLISHKLSYASCL